MRAGDWTATADFCEYVCLASSSATILNLQSIKTKNKENKVTPNYVLQVDMHLYTLMKLMFIGPCIILIVE